MTWTNSKPPGKNAVKHTGFTYRKVDSYRYSEHSWGNALIFRKLPYTAKWETHTFRKLRDGVSSQSSDNSPQNAWFSTNDEVQNHCEDWPLSIRFNNTKWIYGIFKHAETVHSDYLLIQGLKSKGAQVSSGGSSRRRCKAVSLLIMKCQQKQTWLMRGEGLALPYCGPAS